MVDWFSWRKARAERELAERELALVRDQSAEIKDTAKKIRRATRSPDYLSPQIARALRGR